MKPIIVVLAGLLLVLPSCQSSGSGSSVSMDIVSLMKDTMPGGEFIMEVDSAGRVVGAEAQIAPSSVPAACRATMDTMVPGGTIVAAEKEYSDGVIYWELVKDANGVTTELLMSADGKVVGREDVLKSGDVPAGIVDAARKVAPEGELVVVERVSGPEALGKTEYHVKIRVQGEVLRISVLEDRSIGRVVRKIRSEVRVPR